MRKIALIVVLSFVAALAALLAPFTTPIRGWLRGDRDEVPTELIMRRRDQNVRERPAGTGATLPTTP